MEAARGCGVSMERTGHPRCSCRRTLASMPTSKPEAIWRTSCCTTVPNHNWHRCSTTMRRTITRFGMYVPNWSISFFPAVSKRRRSILIQPVGCGWRRTHKTRLKYGTATETTVRGARRSLWLKASPEMIFPQSRRCPTMPWRSCGRTRAAIGSDFEFTRTEIPSICGRSTKSQPASRLSMSVAAWLTIT